MSDSLKITYLKGMVKRSLANITANSGTVNLCIFSIYDSEEPYVLYLLHKLNNKLYWPHFDSKHTDINDYHVYLNKMKIRKYEYQGYLGENGQIYVFIKLENNYLYDKSYNNNINWFVSMYEMILPRKCYKYEIDSSVTDVFIHNINTRYLYQKNNRVDFPEVAYYSTSIEKKEYNTYIGLENNTDTGITVYNYESFPQETYIRVLVFLYNYIVPNITPGRKTIKVREVDIYKDNYEILSCHGI